MTRRHDGTFPVSRREFFGAGVASVFALSGNVPSWRRATLQGPDSLPGTGPSGRLVDPARAGRPLPPVTAADNDAGIQAIEKQLHCTCGCNLDVYTCRTTDFNCTVSPALHQRVLALAGQGMTGQEIIDQFVREHGVSILMAPPKHGFNLAGYFVPTLAILVAAAVLTAVLRRRARPGQAREGGEGTPGLIPAPSGSAAAGATPAELARLQRELDRLPL